MLEPEPTSKIEDWKCYIWVNIPFPGEISPSSLGYPMDDHMASAQTSWNPQKQNANRLVHRCPFPIRWLINRGVVYPLTTGFYDDRWYGIPAPGPSIFTKRTLLGWSCLAWNHPRVSGRNFDYAQIRSRSEAPSKENKFFQGQFHSFQSVEDVQVRHTHENGDGSMMAPEDGNRINKTGSKQPISCGSTPIALFTSD